MSQQKRVLNESSDTLANNKTLIFSINPFNVIDDILLEFMKDGQPATVANIKKAIKQVTLRINGENIIDIPMYALYDQLERLGVQVNQPLTLSNVVGLNLSRLIFKGPELEDFFAWGCANVNTIQLYIVCSSDVLDSEGAPIVNEVAIKSIRRQFNANLGSVIRLLNYEQSVTGAGEYIATNLPKQISNEAYLSLQFYDGGGAIKRGEFLVNSTNIIQPINKTVNDYIITQRGYKPLSNAFDFTFFDGSIRQILPMAGMNEVTAKVNFGTAPSKVCDCIAMTIRNVPTGMLEAFAKNG